MQLLQVCGGCGTSSVPDMRAELAILVDTLDLCCMWLQEGAAAAEDAAAVVGAAMTPGDGVQGAEAAAAVTLETDYDQGDGSDGLCDGAPNAVVPLAASTGSQGCPLLNLPCLQQQQQRAGEEPSRACASSLAVCHELLRSTVSILDTALTAAAAADKDAAVASAQGQSTAGSNVWMGQWMWAEVGSCLLHHLNELVSYSFAGVAVQLPITTLDTYLKVG
jgi:hypothetical protein